MTALIRCVQNFVSCYWSDILGTYCYHWEGTFLRNNFTSRSNFQAVIGKDLSLFIVDVTNVEAPSKFAPSQTNIKQSFLL